MPTPRYILDGSLGALPARMGHSSPARLIFLTGFILSLFLALVAFLDQKNTRLSIFSLSAIVFFFLLLRTPRQRAVPWSQLFEQEDEAARGKKVM
jgi:hypothetical protein